MSDNKLKGLKDLIWGAGIFACIAALVVAFFFCAVTRNENERDDRSFSFSNARPSSSVQANTDGLDAMSAEGDTQVTDAEGNAVEEGNDAQYFNAAEYWSAIANGSAESETGAGTNPDGLDA